MPTPPGPPHAPVIDPRVPDTPEGPFRDPGPTAPKREPPGAPPLPRREPPETPEPTREPPGRAPPLKVHAR